MRKLIYLFVGLSVVMGACKKSGCTDSNALNYSKDAKKDDGSCILPSEIQQSPDAYVYNYTLDFSPGETYETFSGIDKFEPGDVIVTFMFYEDLGEAFFTELPFTSTVGIMFLSEFSESSGLIFINTIWADGTAGSPWASTSTFGFKSVLIKSSGLKKNPDLDLTNYKEVKKRFKL